MFNRCERLFHFHFATVRWSAVALFAGDPLSKKFQKLLSFKSFLLRTTRWKALLVSSKRSTETLQCKVTYCLFAAIINLYCDDEEGVVPLGENHNQTFQSRCDTTLQSELCIQKGPGNSTLTLQMNWLTCALAGKLRGRQFPPFLAGEGRPLPRSLSDQ